MNRRILLFGMKRSGNHGIINWLRAQRPWVFLNNIIPIAPIISGHEVIPATKDFDPWLIERHQAKIKGDDFSVMSHATAGSLLRQDLIASVEDHHIDLIPFESMAQSWQTVLVLRDPVNMLASRLKRAEKLKEHPAYPRSDGPLLQRVINNWKSHAHEFLGHTQFLPNKTNVYFNAWFLNPSYRRNISRQLGLDFNDQGFTKVSKEGGGSSFDGTSKSGFSQKMQVLNRRAMLNEQQQQLLDDVMRDVELLSLAAAVAETSS